MIGILPLFKFFLFLINDKESIFFFVKPSIIWDGWSFDVFLNELDLLYGSYCRGQKSSLPDLNIQFADYSIWHRKRVESDVVKNQIEYWREKLPERLPKMNLPFDRKRPSHFIYKGARKSIQIPNRDVESLSKICKSENLTLFVGFLTVFKILLFRYTDQKELLIGMPMRNRVKPETENLIGHFVNNVLLLLHLALARIWEDGSCKN